MAGPLAMARRVAREKNRPQASPKFGVGFSVEEIPVKPYTASMQPKLAADAALPLLPPRAEMQRAFLASDAAYNRLFFPPVRTTGIFFLPSCPARKPLPQNIEFFATV